MKTNWILGCMQLTSCKRINYLLIVNFHITKNIKASLKNVLLTTITRNAIKISAHNFDFVVFNKGTPMPAEFRASRENRNVSS